MRTSSSWSWTRTWSNGQAMNPPRYVIIANPDGLRYQAYAPELLAYWRGRGVEPDVEVVPWREVGARRGNLDGILAFDRPAVPRLQSPGPDWAVARGLPEGAAPHER